MAFTVHIDSASGQTIGLRLYTIDGTDTIVNGAGGDTLTEFVNALGLYSATVAENITGVYYFRVTTGSGSVVQNGYIYVDNTAGGIFRPSSCYEAADKLRQLSFTAERIDAGLADADGISETLFRTVMLAFAVGPNTVTEVSEDERQVVFKRQDGSTAVVTVSYDPANGQRDGIPTIVP